MTKIIIIWNGGEFNSDFTKCTIYYGTNNPPKDTDPSKEVEISYVYDTGVTANYGDQLLTLSTCEYSQEDGRFVVVCKKIGNEQ